VTVNSGSLSLPSGTLSGAITAASGASVVFDAPGIQANAGAAFNGAGLYRIASTSAGPSLTLNTNITVQNFEVDGSGSLSGTGTLTVSGGLTMNGGTLTGGSTVHILHGATMTVTGGFASVAASTVSNDGTVTFTGGGTMSGTVQSAFTNQADGVINVQTDGNIWSNGTYTNAGALTKSSLTGTGTSTLNGIVSNTGSITVTSGVLSLGTVTQASGGALTGGTWTAKAAVGGTAKLTIPSGGNLTTIGSGTNVTLNGTGASYTNLASLATNQGNFSVLGGLAFTTAGDFTNSGSLTIAPLSVLAVSGNFTQMSAATLTLQLGGTNLSPKIGSVTVAAGKTATLGGTLAITDVLGTKPAVGSTLTILNNLGSGATTGIFAGLPAGSTITVNGMTFQISYVGGTGNDVTLTRIS
jgi:hypothetical protein